ncbi:MAG: SidJ-related pseudokinase [Deltaproteobacteria bacterium]|nr:SidJ-related pseudokinase [Deltaproteobacteria bacterium]
MLNRILFEEHILLNRNAEFPARYIAACNLHSLAQSEPRNISIETVVNLEQLMHDPLITRQRHSFFLLREIAQTMTAIGAGSAPELATQSLAALKRVLHSAAGASHRAAAAALGSLPVPIPHHVQSEASRQNEIPSISLREITELSGCGSQEKIVYAGRSLMLPFPSEQKILVIKLARGDDSSESLFAETQWMKNLSNYAPHMPVRFNIPEPFPLYGCAVFRLKNPLPAARQGAEKAYADPMAIAFTAHADYFAYANDPTQYQHAAQFKEVMIRNAWLFGYLASQGMIHTAPIPLFHNRIQRNRREDNGLYDWPRGGRLDQWLASCRHPNFGLTGTRDFEHIEAISASGEKLYWHLGSHILSLLLVSASFFRHKNSNLQGWTSAGKPIDARHLFDMNLLIEIISETLQGYYQGFTGHAYEGEMPFDVSRLTSRMVEEMGVDRHMEEILRRIDQQQMTANEFRLFLQERGFSQKKAATMSQAVKDMVLLTGPHLGGFNQGISIPELIDATAAMAATCVLGKFAGKNLSHIEET